MAKAKSASGVASPAANGAAPPALPERKQCAACWRIVLPERTDGGTVCPLCRQLFVERRPENDA